MGESEAFHTAQLAILEQIAAAAPLSSILDAIVRAIEAQAEGMVCTVLLLDRQTRRLRHGAAPSMPPVVMQAFDGEKTAPAAGSCGTAAHDARRVIVTDIATHPYWVP